MIRITSLSLALVSIVSLAACGDDKALDNRSSYEMALSAGENARFLAGDNEAFERVGNSNDSNGCSAIIQTIHEQREAVTKTDAWKAFEKTPQWQAVRDDGTELHRAHCKHNDPAPSYACTELVAKIKADFATAQATPEYQACEALPEWTQLKASYDTARTQQCLPSQQDDTQG